MKIKRLFSIIVVVSILPCTIISCNKKKEKKPNLVFVFADEWRAQDTGYAGNTQLLTPNLDKLASEGISFTTAVATCPVCTPWRATMLTGQYPLTHGVFYNDKPLRNESVTIAEVYKDAGYRTAYIGKWHVNGHSKGESVREGRIRPVPKERRQGFDFWRVNECTHDYNNSVYFDEKDVRHTWEGYDAFAQTGEAIKYIKSNRDNPFVLFLSWGPPHAPYQTAPLRYRSLYDAENIKLRSNVPELLSEKAKKTYAGYYAHITALDSCIGALQDALHKLGIEDNTILVFTSDHGDMLYSQGMTKKQKPWDESILVPLIVKYPAEIKEGQRLDMPIGTPDLMPTLLGLSGIDIPESVEGSNFADVLTGKKDVPDEAALITCPVPFHQWNFSQGGREFRGIRTSRYTYAETLEGAWLLYDNYKDPFQLINLCNNPDYSAIQKKLRMSLWEKLSETNDEFRDADYYMTEWDYEWDGNDSARFDLK